MFARLFQIKQVTALKKVQKKKYTETPRQNRFYPLENA